MLRLDGRYLLLLDELRGLYTVDSGLVLLWRSDSLVFVLGLLLLLIGVLIGLCLSLSPSLALILLLELS